jgi:hypothetical protein
MPPHSRTNVNVSHDVWSWSTPELATRLTAGARFGVVIESIDATPVPLVVETSLYWNAPDDGGGMRRWAAGAASHATGR